MSIAVIDYGAGNLKSVTKALTHLGFSNEIVSDPDELERFDAMILPGVGAFPMCMEALRRRGMDLAVKAQCRNQKPLLGICLGMQMLLDISFELGETTGLGMIPGTVDRIPTALKLPHIGWNSLQIVHDNPMTKGISKGDYVYFVHSFCAKTADPADLAMTTDYGTTVAAMIARENVFGCQFHPEKSGDVGMQMLKNCGELNR